MPLATESVEDPSVPLAMDSLGAGEPLVLVHGLATTRMIWRRAQPALAVSRRTVAVDVPGFGASPPAGPGFDLGAVADRIVDGLEAAQVPAPFALVGHSMGGAVALTLADRHPDAVRALVLAAPAGLRPMPAWAASAFGTAAARLIRARRAVAPALDFRWGRRLLLATGTVDGAAVAPADARAMIHASRGATRIREALATVACTDLRPALERVPVPVGAVWGEADRIIPASRAETVRARRPEAPVETVPGAGHIAMMEQPEAFAAALERVLAKL